MFVYAGLIQYIRIFTYSNIISSSNYSIFEYENYVSLECIYLILKSCSKEVVLLANLVSCDAQSVTSKNIALVERESGCSPWDYSSMRVKSGLKRKTIPDNNEWRLSFLMKLLKLRRTEEKLLANTDRLTEMIDSLCDT